MTGSDREGTEPLYYSLSCRRGGTSNVWPWPPHLCGCVYRNRLCGTRSTWKKQISLVYNSSVTLLADAGLAPLMFLFLSPSQRDEVKDSIQCPDHGTGKQKLHTATSFLLRLVPRNNTARAPGKWERNVTFPFRLRGMWHRVDGFCRIGTPEACLSFIFFFSRNVG